MEELDFVHKLPLKGKKIFAKVYENTEDLSLALSAVKRAYKLKNNIWVIKKSVPVKTVIQKSGFFNKSYYLELPISSTSRDIDGHTVNKGLLEKISKYSLIDENGDLDHLKLNGVTSFNGLFKLSDYRYEEEQLFAKIVMNKDHPAYKPFLKNGYLDAITGVSAEFYGNIIDDDGVIQDADRMGWTVTLNTQPSNSDCLM